MTPQEMFDFITSKLIEQGAPSKRGMRCLLRDEQGRKCAVGWVIADEDYFPAMEDVASMYEYDEPYQFIYEELGKAVARTVGPIDQLKLNILTSLQNVHDDLSLSIEDWPESFQAIAKSYNLEYQA